ncbi:HAMP domain-containing sensor histidine kinase [Planobispora takensis]|uniref:HAMP domain-containing sensor histidine kinase n=1 Tax=Planobispora takensis TaxID=1367882 RepID=UPI001941B114|nr:HAMP domain-containing sensor histidine kinase [Planobispora takensis]
MNDRTGWDPDRTGASDAAPSAPEAAPRSRRAPVQSLFWRLFAINGLVFTAGTLVLALSPATVSSPVLLTEVPVLTVGLALILAANALLLRRSLAPLGALTALMRRVDLLRPGNRLADSGNGDLTHVIGAFNEMVDRLEAERSMASAHALAAQEGERQRIARELHDEIGQSLTVVLLGLKRTTDRAPDDLREELHAITETVRASLDEVRQVARRLRPGVLEDLGLISAMNALAADFSEMSGVPVTRRLDPRLPALGNDVELVLYRIAQEGLTNVARHAGASRVELALSGEPGAVVLSITDDGRGGPIREGAGIRGMCERALLIGARLTVRHPPEGGTRVRLAVPDGGEPK